MIIKLVPIKLTKSLVTEGSLLPTADLTSLKTHSEGCRFNV